VQWHVLGVVKSLMIVLSQIFQGVWQWRNFENPLRIDWVIDMSWCTTFFWNTVYITPCPILLMCCWHIYQRQSIFPVMLGPSWHHNTLLNLTVYWGYQYLSTWKTQNSFQVVKMHSSNFFTSCKTACEKSARDTVVQKLVLKFWISRWPACFLYHMLTATFIACSSVQCSLFRWYFKLIFWNILFECVDLWYGDSDGNWLGVFLTFSCVVYECCSQATLIFEWLK